MKIKLYLIGVVVSITVLFAIFINTTTGSVATLHASALAFSYLVYSTLAIVLSSFGKTKSSKAAWFFFSGIAVLFAFLPSLRYLVSWFYIPLHGN